MEGLNDRHLELVKVAQAVRQSEDNTNQALRRHTASFDKFRRESERSMAQLDERTRSLEVSTVELSHVVEGSQRSHKVVKSDLAQVRAQLEGQAGIRREAPGEAARATAPRDAGGRLQRLEEQVAKLEKSNTSDKTQTLLITQTLSDAISKNSDDLLHSRADFEAFDKAVKQLEFRLGQADKFHSEQVSKSEQLKERISKTEADTRMYMSKVTKRH
eukprot:SRR837773.6250.p1 GENE.SRR837773.6250~~SRR837773.6250.p1  ORF type:complete len:240 (+),score=46.97 SRR837773.6250:75-722(+)